MPSSGTSRAPSCAPGARPASRTGPCSRSRSRAGGRPLPMAEDAGLLAALAADRVPRAWRALERRRPRRRRSSRRSTRSAPAAGRLSCSASSTSGRSTRRRRSVGTAITCSPCCGAIAWSPGSTPDSSEPRGPCTCSTLVRGSGLGRRPGPRRGVRARYGAVRRLYRCRADRHVGAGPSIPALVADPARGGTGSGSLTGPRQRTAARPAAYRWGRRHVPKGAMT